MIKWLFQGIALLPLGINQQLGAFLGWCFYLFPSQLKRVSRINIELCLKDLSPQARAQLLRKSLLEQGKAMTESCHIWFNHFERINKKITTFGDEILNDKEAMIFLTPHLGCWELSGSYLAYQHKTTVLYKPLRKRHWDELLKSARQNHPYQLASADTSGVIKLQRALLNKEWVGILPDQNPGKQNGVYVPFFGVDALSMNLVSKLARRHQIKVVMMWAERLPKGRGYHLYFDEVNVVSDQADDKADAMLLNQAIEKTIKQKPEQYIWGYQRFKRDKNNKRTHFYD